MSSFRPDDDIHRASSYLLKAQELHKKVPLCDGHNDIPWCLRCIEPVGPTMNDIDLRINHKFAKFQGPAHGCLHTDIPRLIQGGIGWQFFSVYTPTTSPGPIAVQLTLEQIDIVHRLTERYPDIFEMASTVADVRSCWSRGKIASMCGIEGGHQINHSPASLRMFYKLGCRYMTLTHNGGPGWADPAMSIDSTPLPEAPLGGLTQFGINIVKEMNRIGMLIDLSHVHHVTMEKAIKISKAPVIFSHSSSRALCNHARDVPDHILQLLPVNGGIIMITFVSSFIAGKFWVRGGEVGATIIEVADHIDHVRVIAGIDHIGIGGDYDGCTDLARGLGDVSCYPNLTAELLYRGYTDEDIMKILSGNMFRVLEATERVRDELMDELPFEAP